MITLKSIFEAIRNFRNKNNNRNQEEDEVTKAYKEKVERAIEKRDAILKKYAGLSKPFSREVHDFLLDQKPGTPGYDYKRLDDLYNQFIGNLGPNDPRVQIHRPDNTRIPYTRDNFEDR